MKEFWNIIHFTFTALGGWLGYFLGGWDGITIALVAFITIDYITGVMCAINDKSVSSEVGIKGITRKVMIIILVGVGAILDHNVLRTGEVVRTAIIFYYISNEGISILENATRLGIDFPPKLVEVLEQIKGDDSDENI